MNIEVLKFSATWCRPCRVLAHNLEGVEGIKNIDIDTNIELARSYNVRNVPMLIFLKNGKEVHRQVGAITKQKYEDIVMEINDAKEIN
jgi:thioredoxin 1